jgi:hypothetical protein
MHRTDTVNIVLFKSLLRSEADEIVARRYNRMVQDEVRRDEIVREIEDEVQLSFLRV